jgi:4'-phosphopantetheinyl transferase
MIHILFADISELSALDYDRLFAQASAQRRERAQRYRRREDQIRCVVADALVRYAVQKSLGLSDFTVMQDSFGKPYIQGQKDFHYNLSHSGRWVVIAYGDSPVGIDVQQIQMEPGKEQRICRLFAADEADYILGAQENERLHRFFRIWTAKESYLKFLGVGLRKSLASFSVLPDGEHLGVRFYSDFYQEHCMTLCTKDSNFDLLRLSSVELAGD